MSKYLTTFEPDADTTAIAETLVKQGGAIINQLMPTTVMDTIHDEITQSVSEQDQQGSSDLWPEGNKTIGGLAAASCSFTEQLLIHPKVLEVIDAVLKPQSPLAPHSIALPNSTEASTAGTDSPVDVQPLKNGGTQLVWKPATNTTHCHHYTVGATVMLEIGAGREEHQILHRENAIYQPYVRHLELPEYIVSTMWAGTDFTEDNGATRVVPGSHQWPEERIAQPEEIAQAVMNKGSVVLWLSRTLHGAAKSIATHNRRGFFASYIADWFRQEENQYIAVPESIAQGYSQKARQIIGYRSSPNIGWVKGRDADNLLEPGHSGQL